MHGQRYSFQQCYLTLLHAAPPKRWTPPPKPMGFRKSKLEKAPRPLPTKPIPARAQLGGRTFIDSIAAPRRDRPTAQVLNVDIDTMSLGPLIPFGFIGTSMEWGGVGFYGRNLRDWAKLLAVLGPNPVIRIGGATQDLLAQVRFCSIQERGSGIRLWD